MSVDILCDIQIAFHKQAGRATTYIAYEKTFSNNSHPSQPRWRAEYIGGIDGLKRRLLSLADAAASGFVQQVGSRGAVATRSGKIQFRSISPQAMASWYARAFERRHPIPANAMCEIRPDRDGHPRGDFRWKKTLLAIESILPTATCEERSQIQPIFDSICADAAEIRFPFLSVVVEALASKRLIYLDEWLDSEPKRAPGYYALGTQPLIAKQLAKSMIDRIRFTRVANNFWSSIGENQFQGFQFRRTSAQLNALIESDCTDSLGASALLATAYFRKLKGVEQASDDAVIRYRPKSDPEFGNEVLDRLFAQFGNLCPSSAQIGPQWSMTAKTLREAIVTAINQGHPNDAWFLENACQNESFRIDPMPKDTPP